MRDTPAIYVELNETEMRAGTIEHLREDIENRVNEETDEAKVYIEW